MIKKALFIMVLAAGMIFGAFSAAAQQGGKPAADTRSKDVVFGEFKTYSHADNLFSIDLPSNWTVKDISSATETILSIADPTENAALSIHVWRQSSPLAGGPSAYLKNFLNSTIGSFPNYSMGDAKAQKDGSTGVYFKYDQTVDVGTFRMWGDAFIEQRGDLVGMVVFLIPQEQYEKKTSSAYRLINSFKLRETK